MVRGRSAANVIQSKFNAYLSLDTSQYLGKWIAIFNGEVIASGKNPEEVYKKATKISENHLFMLTKISSTSHVLM